jgi:hypothetical protein
MEKKHDNPNGLFPKMPPAGSYLAMWSVFLGGVGLISSCCSPFFVVWNLPPNLFLGLFGIACAVLSKRGKPFTPRAQLGLILSIISLVCGLIMTFFIIFIYDIMDTNTPLGEYLRQLFEQANSSQMPTFPYGE